MVFIRQKDNHSCGPTCLFNLCQLYNISLNYSFIYKLCKCNQKSGTTTSNFTFALKFLLQFATYYYPCTLVEYPIDNSTHFALIIDNYIINKNGKDLKKPTVQKLTPRFLQYINKCATFWVIEDNGKFTVM